MKFAVGTKLFHVVIHEANVSELQAVKLGRYLACEDECGLV